MTSHFLVFNPVAECALCECVLRRCRTSELEVALGGSGGCCLPSLQVVLDMCYLRNVLQMHFSLFPSSTVGTLFLFIK